MVDAVSFTNVRSVWLKELRENAPEAEVLLAGTKADLRGKAAQQVGGGGGGSHDERNQEVPTKKIRRMVKEFGLSGYVETSARRSVEDVDRVFVEAIRAGLRRKDGGSGDDGGAPGEDGDNRCRRSRRRRAAAALFGCFS